MTSLTVAVSKRVKETRERAGLSQEDVARRADMSSAYVSRLERGVVPNPKTTDLVRIARALGLTLEDLTADPAADDLQESSPDDDVVTYNDLARRVQKATGNRKFAIGFARAIVNWDKLGEAERKLLEAALEVLPDAPEGPEDISKTEF